MTVLTDSEIKILSTMYGGDKNRDATSKIRGFLFQDYITIKSLLDKDVECVCLEYLEDIDIFYKDGTFEFIQVKYYPNTSPDMKEISTDLYYQYLRLRVLRSSLKAKPSLYIHRKASVSTPSCDDMKGYIGVKSLPSSMDYSTIGDASTWLNDNIHKGTKAQQKTNLFNEMASEESLNSFIDEYTVSKEENIDQYKNELMEKLAATYPNTGGSVNSEHWKLILLGLAVSYIQRRYVLNKSDFKQMMFDKTEFDTYMNDSVNIKTEQSIVSYLVGIVCEEYGSIINNNNLTDLQERMLSEIYPNTITWITEIAKDVHGQYRLLNTCSVDEYEKLCCYKGKSVENRLFNMAESKTSFIVFLDYLWKIILNICQDKIHNEDKIAENADLFDPNHYIDSLISDYVCLKFEEDKYSKRSVILPPAGQKFDSTKRKIITRMVKTATKPQKWFFENDGIVRGKNYYSYNTANPIENATVADLCDDSFYIKCMRCIEIDEGKWDKHEICDNCIFSEKCVEEGK